MRNIDRTALRPMTKEELRRMEGKPVSNHSMFEKNLESIAISSKEAKENNKIDHPDHYAAGREFEPIDVINDWDLGFNLGNAVKYISRAGRKDLEIEDLEKARWYLDYEINRLNGR